MSRGWFQIPNIRLDGDRSIQEQMLGLEDALAECAGKTVIDLGCAEGAISRAFAEAGASRVLGIEVLESHLKVARAYCKGYPQIEFVCANLRDYIPAHPDHERFDITLCLGIAHKLPDPAVPLRFAARCTKDLLLFRAPGRAALKQWDGTIKAKHGDGACNVPEIMKAEGFIEEKLIPGVRGEAAQYWRRK